MNLTELSKTRQWPSVAAAVALVALFSLTSIAPLPIQLLPNIDDRQENVLRNTPGLANINSFIGRSTGFVNLAFVVGPGTQTAKPELSII